MKTVFGPAILVAIATCLSGCVTDTTFEQKVADIPGKSDALQRADIHTQRAAEYYKLGRYGIALEAANAALASSPNYAPAYNMLALIYMELREDAKTQAAFEQAIRHAPNDSESLNNYGWFICQRQEPAKSLPYFDRALRDPLYATPERALYNAGVCSRRAGDAETAERHLRTALQRAPMFAAALFELADLSFTKGRLRDAETLFARYTQATREPSADGLLLGVKLSRATGDRSAEASYYAQLTRRFPDAPQTRAAARAR